MIWRYKKLNSRFSMMSDCFPGSPLLAETLSKHLDRKYYLVRCIASLLQLKLKFALHWNNFYSNIVSQINRESEKNVQCDNTVNIPCNG